MMELKGEEAGLKCQLSGATCWFRIEISISQGLGIVSLVFQVYLLLSGSSNISNSKTNFPFPTVCRWLLPFPRFSGADGCIQTRYSVPRFMINFPQRFRITDLLPGFSNYANILNSFSVNNDNWTNEMTFLRGTSALLERSGFTLYCSSPKAHRYWWPSKISFLLRS